MTWDASSALTQCVLQDHCLLLLFAFIDGLEGKFCDTLVELIIACVEPPSAICAELVFVDVRPSE